MFSPKQSPSRIVAARRILAEAVRYLEAGNALRAAQLLQEAELIVTELAKEQALTQGKKPD